MCKLKSAIVLKDRIFMPDYDSHSDMLKELGIEDDYLGASKTFVRAELSPGNGDAFSDIDSWELTVDQDITPDWFDSDETKARMIEKTKEWAKTHIHVGVEGLKISAGQNHYIKDCKGVEIYDSATVENIYGSATVKNICDSATVKNIYGSATVKNICDSATVKNICDSATVKNICDSATVKNICDSATVKNICGGATVENICDSATVKNIYGSATVKNICGGATVENIYGGATVENIYGSATVENICDSATVENICDSATVGKICDSATVKKASGRSVICTSSWAPWHKRKSTVLLENSTLKDNYGKIIYQAGEYQLIHVETK